MDLIASIMLFLFPTYKKNQKQKNITKKHINEFNKRVHYCIGILIWGKGFRVRTKHNIYPQKMYVTKIKYNKKKLEERFNLI